MNGTPVLAPERPRDLEMAPALQGVTIAVDARYMRRAGTGINRYLHDAVAVLREAGAEVTLLANFPTAPFEGDFGGAECVGFGSRYNVFWDQVSLLRFLRRRHFDLYWAPANAGVPLLAPARTWALSTTHDVVQLRLPDIYLKGRWRYAGAYLAWTAAAMLRSDTVITDSFASAGDIWALLHRHATVVAPCLNLPRPGAERQPLPPELAGREYVLYTGGLDPRKNVAQLLAGFARAVERRPGMVLAITGERSRWLAAQIAGLGLGDSAVQVGYVSEAAKWSLLSGARALVYPSRLEGFGLPLIEAFAAGLPVVTARNSALAEVAGDAAIYVAPDDVESIAEAIVRVTGSEVTRDGLRQRGRERLEHYAPERARSELVAVFAGAAASARQAPRRKRVGAMREINLRRRREGR